MRLSSSLKVLALAAALSAPAASAFAWGASGHRVVGVVGAESFPADLPAFLRTPDAVAAIGEYAREPDRWKGCLLYTSSRALGPTNEPTHGKQAEGGDVVEALRHASGAARSTGRVDLIRRK